MLWFEIFVLAVFLHVTNGLKILSVLPFSQKSHHIMFNALLGALLERGHQVTVYSSHRIKTNSPNYTHHYIKTSIDDFLNNVFTFDGLKDGFDREPVLKPDMLHLPPFSNLSNETLSLPKIRKLITSNASFDVILLETMFAQEAMLGFGYRFKAPVVTMITYGSSCLVDSFMGNPNPIVYLPSVGSSYGSQLTFSQRVKTFLYTSYQLVHGYITHLPSQDAVYKKHFQDTSDKPLPPLMDLIADIAMVLLNTQPEVSHPRALVPNMVNVGGMHIPSQPDPLPKEIQKFMDESDSGVIYFSMGSTFKGLPEEILNIFITVFSNIPQRILWKIDEPPTRLPPNIMTVQWAPQTSVLAHRACVAFITHGGLLSLLEAAHSAVPLIGIPLFADQGFNMAKVEEAQLGVRLQITNLSTSSLAAVLDQVLHNTIYKHNMERVSASMRDRQESPLNTAVHWVEYVARHRGAPYLQSPARRINSFQYFMLDVISFLLLIFLSFYFVINKLLRSILTLACNPSNVIKQKTS